MRRLSGDARRLLDAARSAAEPSAGQRSRADASVRARLAEQGIEDLPPISPATYPGPGIATTSVALKVGAAALVVASAFVALQRWRPDVAPAAPAAPASVAPAPLVAPASTPMAVRAAEPEPPSSSEPKAAAPRRASAAVALDQALRAELRLIAEANDLLQDARFREAMQVLDRHGRRFPRGVLRAEREGMRVLSLCGLGPTESALRARERYLRTASQSPLAARVRAACDAAANPP